MAKPLRPKRGTTAKNDAFVGLPSEITVDTDKHSIRVHDGVTAGGHEILPDCLPKSGGMMTGKNITKSGDSEYIAIAGGETVGSSSYIAVYGVNNAQKGAIELSAFDGTNRKAMVVKPDGTAVLGGNNIITSAGGTMNGALAFNSGEALKAYHDGGNVTIRGGTAYQKGAQVSLYGKDHESYPGWIHFVAYNGTDGQKSAYMYPNGSFTWNGKEVERVNSRDTNYIRFESGLQICFLRGYVPANQMTGLVSLPVAFVGAYRIFVTNCSKESMAGVLAVDIENSQTVRISTYHSGNHTDYLSYPIEPQLMCIGYWK